MGADYQGQPSFVSMSGGINKNIYNPNAPAKVAEREHSKKVALRRMEFYDRRSKAKLRERGINQRARRRRMAYRGKMQGTNLSDFILPKSDGTVIK